MPDILARVQRHAGGLGVAPFVLWDGYANGLTDTATWLQHYADVVSALGHSRYLILPPMRRSAMTTQENSDALTIQTALASTYAGNYFDAVSALTAIGDPTADASDIAAGYVPASLLLPDNTHLTAAASQAMAAQIAAELVSRGWVST